MHLIYSFYLHMCLVYHFIFPAPRTLASLSSQHLGHPFLSCVEATEVDCKRDRAEDEDQAKEEVDRGRGERSISRHRCFDQLFSRIDDGSNRLVD